jgi:hypothetical protein
VAQHVWHRDDIARIAATLLVLAPDPAFAAGVLALAHACGADPQLPRAVQVQVIEEVRG